MFSKKVPANGQVASTDALAVQNLFSGKESL
jgi:hypothetical protein